MRLVAIDIGNTNIHVGIFEEEVLHSTYLVKNEYQTDFIKILNSAILYKAQGVILSSVNPKIEVFVIESIQKHLFVKPQRIGKEIPVPISILTEYPETVGVDRLVNALAAFELTKNWTIVVDAGTAITVDGINDKGVFMGGIIAPGIDMSSKALHQYTALLPEVTVDKPESILGKNTEEAIKSGIYWGTIGMINQYIGMLCDELECQPAIIATGGSANMLAQEIPLITTVLPYLTLEGIRITYKKNLALNMLH
jgi:type III pantothenate kinase